MRQEYKGRELSVVKCGGGYNSVREVVGKTKMLKKAEVLKQELN
jgi:hypothetical protein